jgi:nitric oxide reductase NorQ protein
LTTANPFYPQVDLDPDLDTQLSIMLNDPENKDLTAHDDKFPDMGRTILAWSLAPAYRDLDPLLRNQVTKGGHADGRSVASGGSPVTEAPKEETPESYIRPNGDYYFHRPWGAKHNDVEVMRLARENNQYALLYGPPGTGKTALTEAAYGEDLITMLGTGDTEVSDLVGSYVPSGDADNPYVWVDGPLIVAMETGKPFLVDEIGLIDPKVLSILYGAMDGRRELPVSMNPLRGTVKAATGFYVIGATNPKAPGVRLSEALTSRFTLQVEVLTDYTMAEKKLNVNKQIVHAAISINNQYRDGIVEWAPQLRELIAFRDIEAIFGFNFAVENLIASAPAQNREVIAGIISRGPLGKKFKPAVIGSE